MFALATASAIMAIDLIPRGAVPWRFGVCTVAPYLAFPLECMKAGAGAALTTGAGGTISAIGASVGMATEAFAAYAAFSKLR